MAVKSSAHDIADDVRLTLLVAGLVAAWVLFHALRRPAPPGNPPTAQHKTGFTAKRAEAFGRLDAIVIGSSPGGLGAAAMLARRGKKVLVLEANEALGGGLHTWEDHGCPFETGFHYIGEMHCEASPLRRIIDYVAPGVSWAAMADCPHAPGIYDEVTIGGDRPICLKLRPGEGAWTAELIRAFPGEEKAVRRFLKLCKQSAGVFLPDIIWRSISSPTLSRWLRRLMTAAQRPFQSRTADEVLAPLTSNRQLVGALSYIMVSCCGVGPSQAAFAALAGVTCHFLQGGAYPIGGAPSLVAALLHTIQAFGGGAFVCAAVESIVLDARGRAIGVRMKRNGVELRAPVVISTVGVKMTLEQLIPHPAPTSLPGVRAAQARCASSGLTLTRGHLNLFMTFEGSTNELQLPRHNTWVFPTHDHDAQYSKLAAMPVSSAVDTLIEPWVYVGMAFPSAKDPSWADADSRSRSHLSTAVVIAEVPTIWWDQWAETRVHGRGEEYEIIKAKFEAKLQALLIRRFPQLAGKMRSSNLGTPLSTKFYLNKAQGESYGMQPTPKFFKQQEEWHRPALEHIPGLYLAGQDINFDGFAGGLLSGIMCAAAVDGPTVWLDVVRAIGLRALLSDLIFGGEDLTHKYSAVRACELNL